jgi:hypothetical protein
MLADVDLLLIAVFCTAEPLRRHRQELEPPIASRLPGAVRHEHAGHLRDTERDNLSQSIVCASRSVETARRSELGRRSSPRPIRSRDQAQHESCL